MKRAALKRVGEHSGGTVELKEEEREWLSRSLATLPHSAQRQD